MARHAERAPANGSGARCWAAGLILALWLAAGSAGAQRIAYPAVMPSDVVLRVRQRHAVPRIAYPALPRDTRIAPDDFLLDADEDAPPSAAVTARAAELLSQSAQEYRPHPALWRIRGRDSTIYLFGTIHILPPGFAWRSAAVDRAVAEAGTLIVEAVSDGAPAAAPAAKVPLAARVSPGHRAALASFTATLPPGAAAQLDAMPTWMAAIAVGYVRDIQAGDVPGPGADDWLEAAFRARGKAIVPIEDGRQVMERIGAVAEAAQRAMLDQALDTPARPRAVRRAPLLAWARGEVGPGSALTIELDSGNRAALNRPLLLDRNRAWAMTLARRLKLPGTALFAAGAGHFIGRGSVIALLQRRGIRVERID